MPSSQILAYPSVSSSLDKLQYATSINGVPLHAGPGGRAADSEEMLKRGLTSNGAPRQSSALAGRPSAGSAHPPTDALTMRSRKIHT